MTVQKSGAMTTVPDPPKLTALQKRVLAGGAVGQFIEYYDFMLYGLSAVVLSKLFFPGESAVAGLLGVFATFGVAFLVRPLGGIFFGSLGDKIGRRKVLFITLMSIGLATTTIGLLPSHEQIGWLAPALLVLCRLVQGFSAGGESVGAPTFVFEHAPVDRRGLWINITLAATALPSVFAGGLILVISQTMNDDAFTSWGWRIPFLLALPASFFGLWIRSRTEESDAFKKAHAKEEPGYRPVREAFRRNKLEMFQVVFVMGLVAMGFYTLSGYFVAYVQTTGNLGREQSLLINGAAMLFYSILLPIAGIIGDRVGRRPMLIAGTVALTTLTVPSFLLVTSGTIAMAIAGELLFVVPLCIYGGGCYAFFVEIFDTKTRFTSAAISYNTAFAAFGGTAPLVGTALVSATDVAVAPGYYITAAAVLVLVLLIATRVPETRGRID
ncbi:MFS transporter [Rhodococcus erythropolis]|uniref:MFS transporter n=1 Tax=Rhodococcus erythropolis TaxID=1833 RepID=UPI001BDF051E|nr:MFS transporter [Rhodococcus erythropolis]MBT1254587.1 MFS transporter [Rhodococcus erythropolis]